MVRTMLVGMLLLVTGWAGDGTWAQDRAGHLAYSKVVDSRNYCIQQLHGDFFSRTELIFGLSRPNAPDITEQAFQQFIDTVVTPRFPEGLTVLSGTGQFMGSTGQLIKEGSKLLIVFYPMSKQRNAAIERIRAAYKNAFQQKSVLRVDQLSCVSF
ncbi:MAG: DUF3574 domain-containing protein [Methylovulum sp.]|nr:DUF3574 domain-containing protein [Methylovulum sp.]